MTLRVPTSADTVIGNRTTTSTDLYSSANIANVVDYGAVGDGVTDDTAAIQDACNAGDLVYFPTPEVAYLVSDKITCPNNVLVGDSRINESTAEFSKIATIDSNSTVFEFTGTTVGMRYLTVQEGGGVAGGGGMTLVAVTGDAWSASAHFNDCWFTGGIKQLELNLCQGYVVTDCVFDYGWGTAVDCNSAPNLLFANNIVYQPNNIGMWVHGDSSYNPQITNNFFQVQATASQSTWRPSFADMGPAQSALWFDECHGALVEGNVFNYNYQGIGLSSYSGNGCRDIGIKNNLFTGQFSSSIVMNAVDRVTIEGNDFVPYVPGTGAEQENEVVACPHVQMAGACDRITVTGGSMIGNTNRVQGVQLSTDTTNCYVGGIVWEDLAPIVDLGGTGNMTGQFIPPYTAGVPEITGARDAPEGALADLLASLSALGIINDSSTAS